MRIVMMGTGTFAEPTFAALLAAREQVVGLISQPDRDVGRRSGSSRLIGKSLVTMAFSANIPIAQPESINSAEGIAELRAFEPDLVVVAAYGQLLKPAVIAIPKHGFINVHASLLPKYRGAAPVAYAILNGETTTGVTIFRITAGLDSGNILAQESLDILPHETTGELEARLAPVGARLILSVIEQLKEGPIVGQPQDHSLVSKAPKFGKEMGQIDWHQPARQIACLVRAMQPWPTAYTWFHRPGKEPMRVIIASTGRLFDDAPLRPGGLGRQPDGSFVVGTGDQNLEVIDIQPAGKKRMAAVEFLRGYPPTPGCHFGPEH